jgi:hypothetical protein
MALPIILSPLALQMIAKCFVSHIDTRPTCYNNRESIIDGYNRYFTILLSLSCLLPPDSKTASVWCDLPENIHFIELKKRLGRISL